MPFSENIKAYLVVTLSYWSLMLTDGALRMLTLLMLNARGFTPIQLCLLLLVYELFGVITNLFGGILGYHFGLKLTLILGLGLQVGALMGLSFIPDHSSTTFTVVWVLTVQALSGVAKDLTKMSSKTSIKFLIPKDETSSLFKWVAVLTGSKNTIKGIGFFVGAYLLQRHGIQVACWTLAMPVAMSFLLSMACVKSNHQRPAYKNKLLGLLQQNRNIKILSLARVFLFGARDIWFVISLPIFMVVKFNWSSSRVGAFMAAWVMVYGIVQALAPKILNLKNKKAAPNGRTAFYLAVILCLCTLGLALGYQFFHSDDELRLIVLIGLTLFGIIFALNSSLHSYLVLDYADGDKAAVNVGFYYMANAIGRSIGTLLSGVLYQWGGMGSCLMASVIFLLCSCLNCFRLPK